MPRFMVVTKCEGETHAAFFETYNKAHNYCLNAECGMGAYWEMYERQEITDEDGYTSREYVFIEA